MQKKVLMMIAGAAACWTTTTANAGSPVLFEHQANIFGAQPCGGGGCYTRYVRVADLNGDNALDIIYPNTGNAPVVIYENDGSGGFTDVSAAALGGFSGNHPQVAVGDVDGDGSLDLYLPPSGNGNGALFINDGSGEFTNEGAARLPDQPFGAGSTRMADLNDDGHLDLLIAPNGSGPAAVFINDGTGYFEELEGAFVDSVGSDINDIDVLDIDRDFDLDLMTNAHGGANRIWINDGTGVFSDHAFSSAGGLHYGPAVCDVDGDGDVDIWIDNQGPNYTERLWVNDGAGNFTDVTVAQVSGNPGSDDNGLICADTDNDGDLDAVVVALSTVERLLVNDGSGNYDYQPSAFSSPQDSSLGAQMGDLNGDGRLDIATGQGESGSFLNRVYFGNNLVPVDTMAPRIIAAEAPPAGTLSDGDVAVTHYAVNDNAMSDAGPRLSSAYALIDPGGEDTQVAARFMGGDTFRVELPSEGLNGTVTYQLCAEDRHGNTGCSEEFQYDVDGVAGTSGGSEGGDSGSDDSTGGDSAGDSTGDSTGGGGSTGGGEGADDTDGTGGNADNADDSNADANPGDSTTGGTGSTGDAGQDDDDAEGCSCRTDGGAPQWPWLLAALPLFIRRRR